MISLNEHIAGSSQPSLTGIEMLCKDYDVESAQLEQQIAELDRDLQAVKQKHLAGLKRQAGVVARREAELVSAIEAAPGLFIKPRTVILHGVKVGFTTSVGKLMFDDAETVVNLIRKLHKDDAATLVREFFEPNKDALKLLETDALKKLGCKIEGAGDVVICKRVAGDVEKLINKLIEKLVEAMVAEA